MTDTSIALQTPTRQKAFYKRVHEIDFLRGLLILIVLMDHFLNALLLHAPNWIKCDPTNPVFNGIYNAMSFYWDWEARQIFRYFCLFLFCFVSGISSQFSRNNWKRAGEMIVLWGLLKVGSRLLQGYGWLGDTATIIDFNIIGVLAFSTLFYCFVQNCSWRGILAATLAWLFVSISLVPFLSAIPGADKFLNPVIFDPTMRLQTADWMPLCPYIFFFFSGALFSYFFYTDKKSKVRRFEFEKPVCFVGRHTLIIYLGHQLVLVPLFMLVDMFVRMSYGL